MKKNIILFILIFALLPMVFSACDNTTSSQASSSASSADVSATVAPYDMSLYGNLPFNINNSGLVALRDGIVYFRNAEKDGAICACSLAEKTVSVINADAKGFSLNTDSAGIYYIDAADGSLRFVSYSGQIKAVYAADGNFLKLHMYDGKLYAATGSELIRVNTDGSEPTVIYQGVVSYLNIWNNEIYFINGDNRICRLESGVATVISDIYTTDIIVNNGWIFYVDKDQYSAIYKMRTDGTDVTMINYYSSADLCLTEDGVLYYTNKENTYHPTHITVNGEDKAYFTQDKAYGLNLVGDYFIYSDMASNDLRIAKIGKTVPYDFLYFEW